MPVDGDPRPGLVRSMGVANLARGYGLRAAAAGASASRHIPLFIERRRANMHIMQVSKQQLKI